MKKAFTLIELLVVITIIVVLLALLVPAMNKAIYQASLVQCAGRLRAAAAGLSQYAFDQRRAWPIRGITDEPGGGTGAYVNAMQVLNPYSYDVRPPLRGYLGNINEVLQCPLTEPINMETDFIDGTWTVIETSYMMYWGWAFKVGNRWEEGMFRVGDRFTYTTGSGNNRRTARYNVLIGDMDYRHGGQAQLVQSSHPDRNPQHMSPFVWHDYFEFGVYWRLSRWSRQGGGMVRGFLDTHYAYDDLSVRRFDDVTGMDAQDPRMDLVPVEYDSINNARRAHLPTQ